LEIKPHHPATHYYLANVWVAQNQFNKAIYHFSEALRLHPNFSSLQPDVEKPPVPGYRELVSGYSTRQRLDRDINYYQKILADNSQNMDALRRLVIAYSVKGDYDNAFALLQVDKSAGARLRDIARGYADWRPLAN
jgi:tetratricopeptide (TPR) repeat protein